MWCVDVRVCGGVCVCEGREYGCFAATVDAIVCALCHIVSDLCYSISVSGVAGSVMPTR